MQTAVIDSDPFTEKFLAFFKERYAPDAAFEFFNDSRGFITYFERNNAYFDLLLVSAAEKNVNLLLLSENFRTMAKQKKSPGYLVFITDQHHDISELVFHRTVDDVLLMPLDNDIAMSRLITVKRTVEKLKTLIAQENARDQT